MDAKKLAIILGIAVLLPLFLGLFVDAIYSEPKYENYCGNGDRGPYSKPLIENCAEYYQDTAYIQCMNEGGMAKFIYDANGCAIFDECDYCQKEYDSNRALYNRNVFFILAPIGLIIVILGIYLLVDYIGAGLMFAGLITMFYATVRYFTDMSKILRALIILVELLIIMWIAYKKIGDGKEENKNKTANRTSKGKKR